MSGRQTLDSATVKPEPSSHEPPARAEQDRSLPVWIVDSDETTLGDLRLLMEQAGLHTLSFSRANAVLRHARSGQAAGAALIDLSLSDKDGIEVLRELRTLIPELPCFIVTTHHDVESVVQSMKAGAEDYFVKPFDPVALLGAIESAIARHSGGLAVNMLGAGINGRWRSVAMRSAIETANRASHTESPVAITGPHNTGKRAFARYIHEHSKFASRQMQIFNLNAMPSTQMEAKLFGIHQSPCAGTKPSRGLLNRHLGTTLYLEHIELLSPYDQQSLVDWLTNHSPVSAPERCRLIVSSAADIPVLIATDRFRRDLWHALSVYHVDVPALASRVEDLPLLFEDAITRICVKRKLRRPTLTQKALELLMDHSWPGNLSELQSVIEHAVTYTRDGLIGPSDLPRLELGNISTQPSARMIPFGLSSIDEITKASLEAALEACGGNRRRTAQRLKVSLRTVYNMIRRYGLGNPPRTKAPARSSAPMTPKKAAASPPKKRPKR